MAWSLPRSPKLNAPFEDHFIAKVQYRDCNDERVFVFFIQRRLIEFVYDSSMALINLGDPENFYNNLSSTMKPKKWQMRVLKALEGVTLAKWRGDIDGVFNMILVACRQAGKNQTKAMLEIRLASLFKHSTRKATALTFAPTRSPQLVITKDRIKEICEDSRYCKEILKPEWHEWYQWRAGRFTLSLLSADKDANTAGHTATVVEQLDEAQDIADSQFKKICQPMTASTGAPIIFYGTEWNVDSLLHQQRMLAEERQRKSGIKLVHVIPWWIEAEENKKYEKYVLALIDELGEDHVMIRTHFCCEPAESAGNLLKWSEIESMIGAYSRQPGPRNGAYYVAGIDWCAAREHDNKDAADSDAAYQGHDSTVVTVAECSFVWNHHSGVKMPVLRIVDHLAFPGREPNAVVEDVYNFVFTKWGCIKVASDDNGVGNGPTQMLVHRRRQAMIAFSTQYASKSQLGHHLVGAIKTGRLQMYRDDGNEHFREFFKQFKELRCHELRDNAMMKWGHPKVKVNGESIHDDYALSAAYCYEAGRQHIAANYDPNDRGAQSLLDDCEWN